MASPIAIKGDSHTTSQRGEAVALPAHSRAGCRTTRRIPCTLEDILAEPGIRGTGPANKLTLREAIAVTLM